MADALFSERQRGVLAAVAAGVLVAVMAVVYPWILDSLLARFGVRGVALGLLGLLAASLLLQRGAAGGKVPLSAGLAALLLWAAIGDEVGALRLIPAWIYAGLAAVVLQSLRGGGSLIEQAAFWLVPAAPDFIRGYCRGLTALWALFFAASALLIAGLALGGHGDAWMRFTSRDLWIGMALFSAAEFFFRKSWFRHYYWGGPFERLWSRLFPAERTERGRQSLAYIEEYRARIAAEAAEATSEAPRPTEAAP